MSIKQLNKILDKFDFYKIAYKNLEEDKVNKEKILNNLTNDYKKRIIANLKSNYNKDDMQKEKENIENKYNYKFIDINDKYKKYRDELRTDIDKIKNNTLYMDYIKILKDNKLDICLELEEDKKFLFLINKKFHKSKEFNNTPYFKISNFIFQPRFWNFRRIAKKVARNHFFTDYEDMFSIWIDFRKKYISLNENNKTLFVIKEGKQLKNNIKVLEDNLIEFDIEISRKIYNEMVDNMFLIIDINNIEDKNIKFLRLELDEVKKDIEKINMLILIVKNNIQLLQKLIKDIKNGYTISEEIYEKLLSINTYTIPLTNIINLY